MSAVLQVDQTASADHMHIRHLRTSCKKIWIAITLFSDNREEKVQNSNLVLHNTADSE